MLAQDEQESLKDILLQASLSQEGGEDVDTNFSELVNVIGNCIFRFVDHAPEDNQDVTIKVCIRGALFLITVVIGSLFRISGSN